jgi:hypothetical protein
VHFEIVSEIRGATTIARGNGIRELKRLLRIHGKGRWRKRKGFATIQMPDGSTLEAEIHWYDATGVGKREFKLKRILE